MRGLRLATCFDIYVNHCFTWVDPVACGLGCFYCQAKGQLLKGTIGQLCEHYSSKLGPGVTIKVTTVGSYIKLPETSVPTLQREKVDTEKDRGTIVFQVCVDPACFPTAP